MRCVCVPVMCDRVCVYVCVCVCVCLEAVNTFNTWKEGGKGRGQTEQRRNIASMTEPGCEGCHCRSSQVMPARQSSS